MASIHSRARPVRDAKLRMLAETLWLILRKTMRLLNLFFILTISNCTTNPKEHSKRIIDNSEVEVSDENKKKEKVSPEEINHIYPIPVNTDILLSYNWRSEVTPNCYDYFRFTTDSTGYAVYECEIEQENLINFYISNDTLSIIEFMSHEHESIGVDYRLKRDYKYIYTGESLVLKSKIKGEYVDIEFEQINKN